MEAGNFAGKSGDAGNRNTADLMEGMRKIGYTAANFAERELMFGYDTLSPFLQEGPLPFISTNLVYQDSAEPFTRPFHIETVKGVTQGGKAKKIRIGMLGLTRQNQGLSRETADGRRIVTLDPVEAARKYLPELQKKSDLIVVLAVLDQKEARSLAEEVPGIDLILGGFGAGITPSRDIPSKTLVGETRILYSGNQGRRVGEVRVFLNDQGEITDLTRNLIALNRTVPDDPGMLELMEANRLAINEINEREAPLVDYAKLRETYQGAAFVRSEACRECHEKEYEIWKETRHAHAFQILEEKHQDYNPECVGCHTTGFRQATGFVNLKSTPELKNVQCEACHGPGQKHPEEVSAGFGPVDTRRCVQCHTAENSPQFDADAYMLKIRHWENSPPAGSPTTSGP